MPARTVQPSKESVALVEEMTAFFSGYKEWMRSRLPEGETNPARLFVLVSLRRWGALTMGELAGRLARPKPNVTLLVDELENDGLLVRSAHPSDRRATNVELTAAGRRAATEQGAVYDGEIATLFERLPKVERAQLLATIRRLAGVLRDDALAGDATPARGGRSR